MEVDEDNDADANTDVGTRGRIEEDEDEDKYVDADIDEDENEDEYKEEKGGKGDGDYSSEDEGAPMTGKGKGPLYRNCGSGVRFASPIISGSKFTNTSSIAAASDAQSDAVRRDSKVKKTAARAQVSQTGSIVSQYRPIALPAAANEFSWHSASGKF
jgi:hypothetical protein